MTAETDVAIVGAGAAGLATAIFLRRAAPSLRVAVFDTARQPGAKIIVSGGGRCNVTNAIVTEADFWGGARAFIRRVLRALPVSDTVAFFDGLGVPLREEAGGKLFPVSNRSRDVSGALLAELQRSGAVLHTASRVNRLSRLDAGFELNTTMGVARARRVVLATGGLSLPKTGSDGTGYTLAAGLGHSIVPTTPALAPLVVQEPAVHAALSGVSVDAVITVRAGAALAVRLAGALLWTHFGVSGPVALDASRHWERAALEGRDPSMTVDLTGLSFEGFDAHVRSAAAERPRSSVQSTLSGLVPASVAAAVIDAAALASDVPLAHLAREDRRRLCHAATAWPLRIAGSRGYNYAEATAGGVSLDEVRASTMESRVCPGLYFTGEILDVDGRIGGFNFQWAWAGARVAATALANS
jgi:predicted Rossmann fold flavoprotein